MGHPIHYPARVARIAAFLCFASLAGCAEGDFFGPGFLPDRVPGLSSVRFVDEDTIHIIKAASGPGSSLKLSKGGAEAMMEADIVRGEAFRLADAEAGDWRTLVATGSTANWYRFIGFERASESAEERAVGPVDDRGIEFEGARKRAVLSRYRLVVRNERGRAVTQKADILYVGSYGSLFD